MLPEADRLRLRHMLDAASKALRLAARGSRSTLDDEDDPLADALVRLVSLIGEAADNVSPAAIGVITEIPWPDVIGMRHRLIHHYFDVNLDILWATVQDDLPPLVRCLQSALADDEKS